MIRRFWREWRDERRQKRVIEALDRVMEREIPTVSNPALAEGKSLLADVRIGGALPASYSQWEQA